MARSSLIPFGIAETAPISALHREMNRLFDEVFRTGFGAQGLPQDQSAAPHTVINASMNVSESENEVRVTVELPGVTEHDIDVSLDEDVLTIRGEKKFEAERGDEKETFHFMERSYGSFQRSLRLPFSVKPDEVKAAFQNGVLTVTVPKSAQQERSRKIPIHGSASQAQDGAGAATSGNITDQKQGTDREHAVKH